MKNNFRKQASNGGSKNAAIECDTTAKAEHPREFDATVRDMVNLYNAFGGEKQFKLEIAIVRSAAAAKGEDAEHNSWLDEVKENRRMYFLNCLAKFGVPEKSASVEYVFEPSVEREIRFKFASTEV